MSFSYNEVGSRGPGQTIAVPFAIRDRDEVFITVDGNPVSSSLYSWVNDGLISCLSGFPVGAVTRVYRDTGVSSLGSSQSGSSVYDWKGANANFQQLLYVLQESVDGEDARQAVVDGLTDDIEEVNAQVTLSTTNANNAYNSASSAAASATTATTKASEATTSATNAASSATAAASSATSASGSATSASGSASTATTKASEAATSATNAASSATAAASSATSASGSATSAASSASTATTKASEAATSATNAASSATAAATFNPASFLQLSGGTLTGFLTANADPTAPLGVATKQFVEKKSVLAGLRNKVINHRFSVLQRSTTITSGPNYVTDRWQVFTFGTGATGTNAAVLNNPNSYALGYKNLLVFERTGGTSLGLLRHAIEGVETLAGKEITIAVYAYATANVTISAYINQVFGTGGSPSTTVLGSGIGFFNLTTTPTIHYFKTTMASIAGKTLGTNNNDCLVLNLETPTTGAFGLRILDVAVVEGDATADPDPFGNRGLQMETALCQRYWQKFSVPLDYTQSVSSSLIYRGYTLPVQMRGTVAHSTITVPLSFNSTGGTGAAFSSFGVTAGTAGQVTVHGSAAGIAGWQAGGVIAIDSELI